MTTSNKPIHFTGQVIKVQTLTDGGIRITIDISATETDAAAAMMKAKATHSLMECAALFVKQKVANYDGNESKKRKSKLETGS